MALFPDHRRASQVQRLFWSSIGLAAASSLVGGALCFAQHSADGFPSSLNSHGSPVLSGRHATYHSTRRTTLVSPSSAIGFVVAGIGLIMVAGVFIYGLCARPAGADGDHDDDEDLDEDTALADVEACGAQPLETPGCPNAPLLHM